MIYDMNFHLFEIHPDFKCTPLLHFEIHIICIKYNYGDGKGLSN